MSLDWPGGGYQGENPMTTTQPAAELLRIYEQLSRLVRGRCDTPVEINPQGFAHIIGGDWVSDSIATDILEARIWRVLREWADDYEWSNCGVYLIKRATGFTGLNDSLVEAAERAIAHIESRKGEG